jgi:hypothetical protein
VKSTDTAYSDAVDVNRSLDCHNHHAGDVTYIAPAMKHHLADVIAARLSNARKVVMAGAWHMPNMKQPEAFNRIVLDFLCSASQSKTDTPVNPAPL